MVVTGVYTRKACDITDIPEATVLLLIRIVFIFAVKSKEYCIRVMKTLLFVI